MLCTRIRHAALRRDLGKRYHPPTVSSSTPAMACLRPRVFRGLFFRQSLAAKHASGLSEKVPLAEFDAVVPQNVVGGRHVGSPRSIGFDGLRHHSLNDPG